MNGRQSSISSNTLGVGIVPRAVQLEFEREEKKIQQFETTNKKFYKDVKYYIEKLDELIKSESKMINNIANLAQTSLGEVSVLAPPPPPSPKLRTTAAESNAGHNSNNNETTTPNAFSIDESNREFLAKLVQCRDELLGEHARSADAFKTTNMMSVVEPMKSLNSIFPQVYKCIKRREAALKELLKQQDKLDKLQDKERTGPNLVRINELNMNVNQLKQQFQKEHLFLMDELPKLYASRIDYIKPCVNTLIDSQAKFYQEYSQFYESILNPNNMNNNPNHNDDSSTTTTNESQQPQLQSPTSSSSTSTSSSAAATTAAAGTAAAAALPPDYMNLASSSSSDSAATETQLESLNSEIQQCLKDIKSLSIVASD